MELIFAAGAACAIFMPVLLILAVAALHPGAARCPAPVPTAEDAARAWLAAHPLKPRPAMAAANDAVEPIAA